MSLRFLTIVGACLMAAQTAAQVDPGNPDTVKVDSVTAYTTGIGILPVRFYNDQELSGLEVTLEWDHPDVSVDSFSFAGSRVGYANLKGAIFDDSTITVYSFPFTGQPLIAAGNGLLGNIYFSYPTSVGNVVVRIDTVRLTLARREYATQFSTSETIPFGPRFTTGYLDIQDTVCCVGIRGNVDGQPDDQINVADITYLVAYLFQGGAAPPCQEEGNVDGGADEQINVADLTYLVAYVFQGGALPPACPT
ncbi:MAG: hypothetical protein AB1744_05910 [Candidatus Zixiibacteriota bacterium]